MNVLHVVPTLSPRYGGPSLAALGMYKALVRQGVDVSIVATRSRGEAPMEGVAVHEFPRQFEAMLPSDFSYSPMLTEWLKLNLKRYDLLHVHTLFTYTTMQACRTAEKWNIPYILQPCGMLDPWSLRRSRLKKKVWMALYERRNLDHAAAIHFTSKDEKKGAEPLRLSAPGVVIPIGVDLNSEKEERNRPIVSDRFRQFTERKKIIFLSRLHPKKGLDLLIPALGTLARKRDDFVFILAGSGELKHEREVKDLLALNGLDRHTVITGFVEGVEKSSLLSQSDLFVLPSYHENFGLAVAEAMAAGLPIVISDRVNIHHDVQAYKAGLVTTCDVSEIAGAIEKLLDNDALRKQMGENGRRLVHGKYNWDVIAPKIIKLYERVLSGKVIESDV